jgi:UDP-N-acetylmuramoyl-tripeptide--D-alanyl-D-alanine ligase
VRPHVAVITTIEAVHLEFFASTTEIAAAKAEIFQGVEPGGSAILPRDNPHFAALAAAAVAAGIATVESFGSHIEATARLLDCAVDPEATLVFALFGDHALSYRVGVPGRQWATNSLATLLAARAAGCPLDKAAAALGQMRPPKGRGLRQTLRWGGGLITLIDESYNASPVSVRAAIATLEAIKPTKGARRIAVLGDMRELGTDSARMHADLADTILPSRVDLVFAVGALMRGLYERLPAPRRGAWVTDAEQVVLALSGALAPGDVVMVKGSLGSRMGLVVKALEEVSAQNATPSAPTDR